MKETVSMDFILNLDLDIEGEECPRRVWIMEVIKRIQDLIPGVLVDSEELDLQIFVEGTRMKRLFPDEVPEGIWSKS